MPVTVTVSGTATTDPRPVYFETDQYNLVVSEGVPIGYVAETIHAKSGSGQTLSYVINSGNTNTDWRLVSDSGELQTAKYLDREKTPTYKLIVRAQDVSGNSATATVSVTVSDINDNDPKFGEDVYRFQVPENSADHLVGTVTATDADSTDNTLTYSLEYPSRCALWM